MNSYVNKVTKSINDFNLNVVVANVYEIYNLFQSHITKEVSDSCLKRNFIKLMKMLIPFTPHIAYECLEMLEAKEIKIWPKVDSKLIQQEKIGLLLTLDCGISNGKEISIARSLLFSINNILLSHLPGKLFNK